MSNVTSTAFHLSWLPPLRDERNGVIIQYYLCIREFGVLHDCNNTKIIYDTKIYFTDLKPNKEYLVEIKAGTTIGFGPPAFTQKMAGEEKFREITLQ